MNQINLLPMSKYDIEELTPIMERAFNEDSNLHLGHNGGPQGYDNGDFLRKWAFHPGANSYCISYENKIIGATILWINKNNENFLGCIFIDSLYENKGLGLLAWKAIERMYPDTLVWRTETPIFSHRNHNFYINKCGFHVVKIENPKNYEEGQFNLEKVMKP